MPPIIDTITSLIFLIGKGSPYIDYNNYIKARYSYGVSSFLLWSHHQLMFVKLNLKIHFPPPWKHIISHEKVNHD